MPNDQTTWQSHQCEGYRAKITVEWSLPPDVEFGLLPPQRRENTEDIADAIMRFAAPRVRDMVMAMRGYRQTKTTDVQT